MQLALPLYTAINRNSLGMEIETPEKSASTGGVQLRMDCPSPSATLMPLTSAGALMSGVAEGGVEAAGKGAGDVEDPVFASFITHADKKAVTQSPANADLKHRRAVRISIKPSSPFFSAAEA
jgi:hypothetical protein